VWLLNPSPKKFESKWLGPYRIHRIVRPGVFQLATLNGRLIADPVHRNRLKLAKLSPEDLARPDTDFSTLPKPRGRPRKMVSKS
jgi:hypothetical protein